MSRFIRKLQPREIILAGFATVVIVSLPILHRFVLPTYDEWQHLKSSVVAQSLEYAQLRTNLSVKQTVNEQFETLGPKVFQKQSNQIALSNYLRELETLARYPSLTLISMKPMTVKVENTYKTYRVKLAVAGKLQEILLFVSELTHGITVTGLEAFSLRAVQRNNMVECSLSLCMVKLIPEAQAKNQRFDPILPPKEEI